MFSELLKNIAVALDAGGFPYMVIGGQAVLVYGEPRLTKDIDITVGASLDRLTALVRLVETVDLEILVDPDEFTTKTLVLPCRDRWTGIRVDFMFCWSIYEQEALRRCRSIDLLGTAVRFASLEDVVIHKIIAGRPRDLEDVRLILIKNPEFDRLYIEHWLKEFDEALAEDLGARFKQVRQESKKES
jgi:hypothetical protein